MLVTSLSSIMLQVCSVIMISPMIRGSRQIAHVVIVSKASALASSGIVQRHLEWKLTAKKRRKNWSFAWDRRFSQERSDEPPGRIDRSIRDRDRRPIFGPTLCRTPDRRTPRHDPLSFTFTTARCKRRLIGVSYFFPSLRHIDVTKTPPRGRLRTFFILFFLIPSNTLKCYFNGFGGATNFSPDNY